MGVLAPLVMSATTFAGSAQFAAASILAGSGSAVAAITAAVLLNARYVPISISVAQLFHGPRLRRLAEPQLIVDESWALAGRGGRFDRRILIGAGLLLYVAWVSGTAVGVLAGDALGDPKNLGLDGAFPALFLPQLRGRRAVVAALVAAGISLALIPVTPPGTPIVAASAACLLGLRRSRWARSGSSCWSSASPRSGSRPPGRCCSEDASSRTRSRASSTCSRPCCSQRSSSPRPWAATTSSCSTRAWRASGPERPRSRPVRPCPRWSSSPRPRRRSRGCSSEAEPSSLVRTFSVGTARPDAAKSRDFRGGIASMRAKKGARWGSHACFRDREFGPKRPRGRRWAG